MLTKYTQAASISSGCKERTGQVADHLILVPAPCGKPCAFLQTSLASPTATWKLLFKIFLTFYLMCVCVRGGWGWSGREEKVEIVQEVWITDSSFPWTKYSTFPERRQRLQFRSWPCTVPEIHTIPGAAVNCWAAAAGSALTCLAGLWPGVFQGRCPSWCLGLQRGVTSTGQSCPAPLGHCSGLPQCCLSTCLARPSHSKKG